MKPNEERKLTFEEEVQALMKTFVPLPKPKPKAIPKPKAVVKADARWSGEKPLAAVLQDVQRAEEAATEKLRKEREREEREAELRRERDERIKVEHDLAWRQAAIDAAWQRSIVYQRELARWGSHTCHRGPGDPDW
jgi:hypothetical protein